VKAILFGVVALLGALPLSAQVGYEPARSPYVDLDYTQEVSVLFGYLRTRHDPAGIAPQSAPLVGLRYELALTGPLALSSDITRSFSRRDVLEPTRPAAQRAAGTENAPVYAVDLALALNLTGEKSWHHMVPQVRAGLGVVHSSAKDDSSGFSFGTPFAFSIGGGLKFVPTGGRLALRADVTDRIFKLSYPDAYYRLASDNTAVLPRSTSSSFYTHHAALTVGVSYLFRR
jgi:hypothetical protein